MIENKTASKIIVELDESEIDYLIACGSALLQNIPEKSLPTYCDFTKDQILRFTEKIHKISLEAGKQNTQANQ